MNLINSNILNRLRFSFFILISILLTFGIFSVKGIKNLTSISKNIIERPLSISTKALQINIDISNIHKNMKNLVLYSNDNDRTTYYTNTINNNVVNVYKLLKEMKEITINQEAIIFINNINNHMVYWKTIRDEVLYSIQNNKIKEAGLITIGKGAIHVITIEKVIHNLVAFEQNVANELLYESEIFHKDLIFKYIIFLFMAMTVAIFITISTINKIKSMEINQTNHQKKLKQSEEKLQNIINTSPVGIYTADSEGNLLSTNTAYEKMVGYSKEELSTMSFYDVTHSDYLPENLKKIKHMFSLDVDGFHMEKKYVHKNGTNIDVSVHAIGIMNDIGVIEFGTAFVEDITKRKLSENLLIESKKELEEREQFISSVMDNLPIGVAVNSVDPETVFTYMNDAYPIHYHTTREELMKYDNFWNAIFEDEEYRNNISNKVIADCASGDPSRMHWEKVEIKRDDKIVAYVNARNTPFTDNSVMISTVLDVTRQTEAENALIISSRQLLQSKKMESIGTLAAGIAHDFNNILFIIKGNIELLLSYENHKNSEKEKLKTIDQASDRATKLIRQIVSFSKQSDEALQNIDIKPLIQESVDLSRSSIPKNIDIVTYIKNEKSIIKGDGNKIAQVALNLITNAFHAVEDINGQITIALKNVHMHNENLIKKNLPHGNYAQLTITDNGCGISNKNLERIFDPYFTTKEKSKGSGLGLSIVYGIITESKGFINVYSEVNKGTTVNVYIPLINDDETEKSIYKYYKKINLTGTGSIMLVDDEKHIGKILKRSFDDHGYNSIHFLSPIKALEEFKKNPDKYDLIISDISMPKMTGTELASKLLKVRPEIPIILCSGFSEKMNGIDIKELGVRKYYMKPVNLKKLLNGVKEILNE